MNRRMNWYSASQIGQCKGRSPIAAKGRSEDGEQCLIAGYGQQLPIAKCPSARWEVSRKEPDGADVGLRPNRLGDDRHSTARFRDRGRKAARREYTLERNDVVNPECLIRPLPQPDHVGNRSSGGTLRPLWSLGTLRALLPLRTLSTLGTFRTLRSPRPCRAARALRAGLADRPLRSLRLAGPAHLAVRWHHPDRLVRLVPLPLGGLVAPPPPR